MIKNDKSVLPPWLSELEATLAAAADRGRFPHAVLIHGTYGSGRRRLVTSVAAQHCRKTVSTVGLRVPVDRPCGSRVS